MEITTIEIGSRLNGGYDGPYTVAVGDCVGFKADTENIGRIMSVVPSSSGPVLVLKNAGGFRGDDIGGHTTTRVRADGAWPFGFCGEEEEDKSTL